MVYVPFRDPTELPEMMIVSLVVKPWVQVVVTVATLDKRVMEVIGSIPTIVA